MAKEKKPATSKAPVLAPKQRISARDLQKQVRRPRPKNRVRASDLGGRQRVVAGPPVEAAPDSIEKKGSPEKKPSEDPKG